MDIRLGKVEFVRMLKRVDTDKDGQISFKEFVVMMLSDAMNIWEATLFEATRPRYMRHFASVCAWNLWICAVSIWQKSTPSFIITARCLGFLQSHSVYFLPISACLSGTVYCCSHLVWPYLAKFRHFGSMLSIWHLIEGLFSIWQNLLWLCTIFPLWGNFHCCEWPKIEQIIKPSGHTSVTFWNGHICTFL